MTLVCVESWLVLHASIGRLHHEHNDKLHPTGNDCLAFPDGNVHLPDNVNVSENDESAEVQVSENLDSCVERSFLSQRQCRRIYQQLRNSDLCLEENFSALMHGNNSDSRVCFLEVCAARDSPLINTVRQRLYDISSAERWTSRDHHLSKTSGRRPVLTNFEIASLFWFQCAHLKRTTKRSREIHCLFVQLVGSGGCCPVEMRACCCGKCI